MDKIFDANDRAKELGFPDHRAMFVSFAQRNRKRWTGKIAQREVFAYVAEGRWLADCAACREPAYVTPSDPIHFCAVCGNAYLSSHAARVVFPENRAEIEAALLERPAVQTMGAQKTVSLPVDYKTPARNWRPGENAKTLRKQAKGRK